MARSWVTLVVLLAVTEYAETLASDPDEMPKSVRTGISRTSVGRNNANSGSPPNRAILTGPPETWIEESDENGGTFYLRGLGFHGPNDANFGALAERIGTLCKPNNHFLLYKCKLADPPPADLAYLFTSTPHVTLGEHAKSDGRKLLSSGATPAPTPEPTLTERQRRNNAEPKWFIIPERLADFRFKHGANLAASEEYSVSGLEMGTEKWLKRTVRNVVNAKVANVLYDKSGTLKYTIYGQYNSTVKFARVVSQYGQRSFKQGLFRTCTYSFIKLSVCRPDRKCSVKKMVLACSLYGANLGFTGGTTRACNHQELDDVGMHA